ncbi:MAG: ribonuclease HII [Actinobacteria bacterium]|nr:ribonuclease HII [Actinomycetota bacterium]
MREVRTPMLDFDRERAASVAGADEAGRGCLAGPIVAAGVRFDYESLSPADLDVLASMNDSKKLSAERREQLFGEITRIAGSVAVVVRSAPYIDSFGLHRTNLHCLGTALQRVATTDSALISDGYMPFGLDRECEAVVKGDARSTAVAAASIVAKVSRDRFMHRASVTYGGWGFEQHVGYATPTHHSAIRELGLTPLHRRSFASVAYEQIPLVA